MAQGFSGGRPQACRHALAGGAALALCLAVGAPGLAAPVGGSGQSLGQSREAPLEPREPASEPPLFAQHGPLPISETRPDAPPLPVRREGRLPSLPPAFDVSVAVSGLEAPRWAAVAPDGRLFVSEPGAGKVQVAQLAQEGPVSAQIFARRLHRPHGLLYEGDRLLVSDQSALWAYSLRPGRVVAEGPRTPLTRPGSLGRGGLYWERVIGLHPEGRSLLVTVGARRSDGRDPLPFGSIQEFSLTGADQKVFAAGLEVPLGLAIEPVTGTLFGVASTSRRSATGMAAAYLTALERGVQAGLPGGARATVPAPTEAAVKAPTPARVSAARDRSTPVVTYFPPRSKPYGLAFVPAAAGWPAPFNEGAFVSLYGAAGTSQGTAFQVVFVPFQGGEAAGLPTPFLTDFWRQGPQGPEIWGRPAGLVFDPWGNLLVVDERSGLVWRVSPRR